MKGVEKKKITPLSIFVSLLTTSFSLFSMTNKTVVQQDISIQVSDEVTRVGGVSSIPCVIPSFGREWLSVSHWQRSDGVTIFHKDSPRKNNRDLSQCLLLLTTLYYYYCVCHIPTYFWREMILLLCSLSVRGMRVKTWDLEQRHATLDDEYHSKTRHFRTQHAFSSRDSNGEETSRSYIRRWSVQSIL